MEIIVNGKKANVESPTIGALVEELSISVQGVAIALNKRVVPRAEWNTASLKDNDNIVIVSAVYGG